MSTRNRNSGPNAAGLILAAGMSKRAGDVNKLLHLRAGKPLIQHVAQALTDSQVRSVVVVVGHDAKAVETALRDTAVAITVNMDYERGMSDSLRHGVSILFQFDAVIVCLADMPHLTTDVVNGLIRAMAENPEKSYFVPVYRGQRGNPVLITKLRFDEIMTLSGDEGARSLLRQNPKAVMEVPVANDCILVDYDTPEDLENLND